jgi:hypothetical protein
MLSSGWVSDGVTWTYRRMSETRLQILGVVVAGLLTPLSIFVVYTEWSLIWDHPGLATRLFSKWPWFTGTCALTMITFLYPYFVHWRNQGDYQGFKRELPGYFVVLFVAVIFFFYPGASGLGIHSDGRGYPIILLIVASQYAGLSIVAKGVFPPPIEGGREPRP